MEPGDYGWYNQEEAYDILKDFCKNAQSMVIYTDDPDNELFDNVDKKLVKVIHDTSFYKDKGYKLCDEKHGDWTALDRYSLKVDGNKLYMSPYTGQGANSGDEFSVCLVRTL